MSHPERTRQTTPPSPSPRSALGLLPPDIHDSPALSASTLASSPPGSPTLDINDELKSLRAALAAERSAHKAARAAFEDQEARIRAALDKEEQSQAALEAERARTRHLQSQLERRRSQDSQLSLLGQGCFGYIYGWASQMHVYKCVKDDTAESAATLQREFEILGKVYQAIGDKRTAAEFISPRPWAFNHPSAGTTPVVADGSPQRADQGIGYRQTRQAVRDHAWEPFITATMALDLIPSLHTFIQQAYRQLFFDTGLENAAHDYWIPVLRLYFGRHLPNSVSELPEGPLKIDMKLDIKRYKALAAALGERAKLPDLNAVARGMGDMLASLHYGAGIDGRDIELVLAGDRYLQARAYVFDYNQCRPWLQTDYLKVDQFIEKPTMGEYACDDIAGAARRLAKLIFYCEYYYPRPRIDPDLWGEFVWGYKLRTKELLFKHGSQQDIATQINTAADTFLAEFARLDAARTGWTRPRITLNELETLNTQ